MVWDIDARAPLGDCPPDRPTPAVPQLLGRPVRGASPRLFSLPDAPDRDFAVVTS